MSDDLKGPPDQVSLPVNFFIPDDVVSKYATNLLVQHTEQEFIISYFEARPPIVLGDAAQLREKLESIGEIKAVCVARIVVSPERMESFVEVMRQNLANFRAHCAGEK